MNLRTTAFGVAALAGSLAGTVCAGELSSRYEAMGEMVVELGGETMTLAIPFDTEKNRGYAEQKMIMGSVHTINSVGRAVDDSGALTHLMVQVTLQKHSGSFKLLLAELFDAQGFDAPMAMGADGGKGAVTALSLEGDHLEATVEGTFLRLTGYSKGDAAPAEGAEPQPVTIRWSVDLPPLE